ncbi:MAG TPA: radical SAM family heme chaperone HemW [Anaerolineales bacterium]|nr:radical SAM family heme chaperone HemW [Anaerolineales bacterium]
MRKLKSNIKHGILLAMAKVSLYLHIPFCTHRCGYCDFNTYAGVENLIPAYVRALTAEMAWTAHAAGERLPVHTIFFGGGTPSLLPAAEVGRILSAARRYYEVEPAAEITLEANPGTLQPAYLFELRRLGVNRLSLGVQSANPEELRLLERRHDFPTAAQAVTWAREAGFDNMNLDLIFGLPGQTLVSWQRTLDLALGLEPEHLALYALTVEHGTPLAHWTARGLVEEADPDLAADMYEWAQTRLADTGFWQYEISNWAKGNAHACRHNLQYWRGLPYLGFGAGAHGFAGGFRTANVLAPSAYIQRLKKRPRALPFPRTPATASFQAIDQETEIGETMMMGLRLTEEGVGAQAFEQRFGNSLQSRFQSEIQELIGLGLLEWAPAPQRLRLTARGRLLGNQVFYRFI